MMVDTINTIAEWQKTPFQVGGSKTVKILIQNSTTMAANKAEYIMQIESFHDDLLVPYNCNCQEYKDFETGILVETTPAARGAWT